VANERVRFHLEQKQTPPFGHLVRVDVKLLRQFCQRLVVFARIKGFAGAGVGDQGGDPAERSKGSAIGGIADGLALNRQNFERRSIDTMMI